MQKNFKISKDASGAYQVGFKIVPVLEDFLG
jgi:hypothetical protein